LGVGFDDLTMDEALARANRLMREKRGSYIVTPNPEIVMMCRENEALAQAIAGAEMVLADGVGIEYGAKILGTPLKRRLPGIDFVQEFFGSMAVRGKSLFLLGAKPGVAEKAAENLKQRFPGLKMAGTHDGYFKEDAPVIDEINAVKPDLLLVCLGAPKQELWMAEHASELDVGLMAGLGGSLDIFAGVSERAPENWRKLGLEWLYRLKKEPSRAKRMAVLPVFGFKVIGERLRK